MPHVPSWRTHRAHRFAAWRQGVWLLPLVLSGAFMAAVAFWAAGSEATERRALGERQQADAGSVRAQLDGRLDLERARLREVALRLQGVADPARVDLQHMPEVIAGFDRLWNRLVWVNGDLRVLAVAERPAGRIATAAGTDALRIQSRGQADHLEQPVPTAAGAPAGRLLARFDLVDLLRSTDLAWLSGRYEVTFVSELGEVIATTAQPGRLAQGLLAEWPLPAFGDARLRLTAFLAPRPWYGSPGTQLTLTGLFVLGVAATLLLRREVGQVRQAGIAARTEAGWRRSMEDSALVGLRARDAEGRILYVNKTLCEMVGYGAEELVGLKPPLPFWPPESVPELMANNLLTLSGGAPSSGYERRWRHRDGHAVDVVIYESPLVDGEGRHIGWMGSIVDIGERKRLEDRERRHIEELAQHTRLNGLGLIASELAHELNQPLAALAGYSAGLAVSLRPGGTVGPDVGEAVQALQRNARKAGDIVNWIRRQGSRASAAYESCDLNRLIEDVLEVRRRWLPRSEAQVRLSLESGLPAVSVDRIGIEQVLMNLVRNAADAIGEVAGPAVIEVRSRALPASDDLPQSVEVSVCDNGPGLRGRSLEALCATFYSTKRDGMGLGLGISRAIVEQHGGRLVAVDRPEGGASFFFRLPVQLLMPVIDHA